MHFRAQVTVPVVFVLCLCAVSSRNVEYTRYKRTLDGVANSCEEVRPFFKMRNVTAKQNSNLPGPVCGGPCCDAEAEAQLRSDAGRSLGRLLQHSSRSLQGVLNSTAVTLQKHVSEIADHSENRTLLLISSIFRNMSVFAADPIRSLYSDIRRYVRVNITEDGECSTPDVDVGASLARFFTVLFPLAYHVSVEITGSNDFTADYRTCLQKYVNEIKPFKDIPRSTAQSLTRGLDATSLLLRAFATGVHVLNTTERLFTDDNLRRNGECHAAVLRMNFCPRCLGVGGDAKPCSDLCLNVLRGCLARYAAELDAPWNDYVDAVARLVNAVRSQTNEHAVNLNLAMKDLDTKITEAIMYFYTNSQDIFSRAKWYCGAAKFSRGKKDGGEAEAEAEAEGDGGAAVAYGGAKPRQTKSRTFPSLPEPQLLQLLASLAKSKGFYGGLADTVCRDKATVAPDNQHCWNGERIAEYTKIVTDISLDSQKYNPEVMVNASIQTSEPLVADLADKLRQIRQSVAPSLGLLPVYEQQPDIDSMQRDDGDGVDGSGSGSGPDEEDEDMRGSGSGDNNLDETKSSAITPIDGNNVRVAQAYPDQEPTAPVSAGAAATSSVAIMFVLILYTVR